MTLRETRSWWIWIALAGALALVTAVIALAMTPAPAAAQESAAVAAVDNAFSPVSVEISAGGTVTWTNNGAVPHTVTGENFAFDVILNPGESASHTFSEAGTYSYLCQFHPPGMVGTVVVVGDPGDPADPADPPPATEEEAPTLPTTGVGTAAGLQSGGALVVLTGLLMLIGLGALRPQQR